MKSKIKKIILVISGLVVLSFSGTIAGNNWLEKLSSEEASKRNLAPESANAIKHAYAAHLLYTSLRDIGFENGSSEETVIFLGKANELAELIFKFGRHKDSNAEMMKDLYNNMVGLKSAEWLIIHQKSEFKNDRLGLIGKLAEEKVLILSPDNVPLPEAELLNVKNTSDLLWAINWFEENRKNIQNKINTHLN